MSIAVNIYYTGTDGNARKFAEEMEGSGTVAAIRREEGNLRYEYFIPIEDPETVLLIDSWRDQEAIDRHHASPMMQKLAGYMYSSGENQRGIVVMAHGFGGGGRIKNEIWSCGGQKFVLNCCFFEDLEEIYFLELAAT